MKLDLFAVLLGAAALTGSHAMKLKPDAGQYGLLGDVQAGARGEKHMRGMAAVPAAGENVQVVVMGDLGWLVPAEHHCDMTGMAAAPADEEEAGEAVPIQTRVRVMGMHGKGAREQLSTRRAEVTQALRSLDELPGPKLMESKPIVVTKTKGAESSQNLGACDRWCAKHHPAVLKKNLVLRPYIF